MYYSTKIYFFHKYRLVSIWENTVYHFLMSIPQQLHFLKQGLLDRQVASVIPTAAHNVRKIIQQMDLSKDSVIVEYGPGTGVFSKELLKRMTPGSHLILIETNEQFVSLLKQIDDERLTVIHGSAEDVTEILKDSGHTKANYILSGIPFSLMPADLRKRIMQRTKARSV